MNWNNGVLRNNLSIGLGLFMGNLTVVKVPSCANDPGRHTINRWW